MSCDLQCEQQTRHVTLSELQTCHVIHCLNKHVVWHINKLWDPQYEQQTGPMTKYLNIKHVISLL